MSKARSLLQQADRLSTGGSIRIRCRSFQEMESLRTSLSRLASNNYPELSISRNTSNLSVTIAKREYDITIQGELSEEAKVLDQLSNLSPEMERIVTLMRQDGVSESEIAAFIKEATDGTKSAAD